MNVLLGGSPSGCISVAFVAGYGITVFNYHAENNHWQRLGSETVAGINMGEKFSFEIKVRKDQLSVRIEDQEPIRFKLDNISINGPWGLGAQAGSAGIWYDIHVN